MWTPACSHQLRLPVSDWGRPAAHSSYASLNWPSRCSRTYAPKRPFHCTHHTLTGPGGQQVSVKKNVPRKCTVNTLPVWRSHPVISKSARASTKKKAIKLSLQLPCTNAVFTLWFSSALQCAYLFPWLIRSWNPHKVKVVLLFVFLKYKRIKKKGLRHHHLFQPISSPTIYILIT